MAENDKVKVVGFAQRTFFDDGIEYRNFSDNLVGQQIVEDEGTALFTLGNFKITTNLTPKTDKRFKTKSFSNFVTLNDLDLTCQQATTLLQNNAEAKLKLDRTNLCNYAYFGSTVEYVRVTLEGIITNWPASIYMNPIVESGISTTTGHTMQNYTYDVTYNEATFNIANTIINNKFSINYQQDGSIIDTFNETNDLRNLTVNFRDYVVFVDDVEYPIIEFTGATNANSLLTVVVEGNPFTGTTSFKTYHIKPKSIKVEEFFNGLDDLESYLLNRMITPEYTSTFRFPTTTEEGVIIFKNTTITWPVSDGYNIDFDTTEYIDYVTSLLNIATNSDLSKSNLIVRFLTSDSISDFDTLPNCDGTEEETAGQKVNKTLNIYGREFDEIKRYTDGIQWANTVTYNQTNNTPDIIIKNLARTLGWELVSSVLENDLLKSYVEPKESTFSGHSRGLTPIEAEYELWRRLVLNSSWLWKSKGTRKAIEFLFKFIGAPNGLMSFNEYVYRANSNININQFNKILVEQGEDTDLQLYSVDSEGFPRAKPDTPDLYFQKGGLWYRETGGSGATIDVLNGNNPHVGPYDGGNEYMNQFNVLIPNFEPVTITNQTISSGDTNIFINYNSGLINNSLPLGDTEDVYIDVLDDNNQDQSGNVSVLTEIIEDPFPTAELTDCGCETGEGDHSIRIKISKNPILVTQSAPELEACLYRMPFPLTEDMKIENGCAPSEPGYAEHLITKFVVNGNVIFAPNATSFQLNCANLNVVDFDADGVSDSYTNLVDFLNQLFQAAGLSNYSAQIAQTPLINQIKGGTINAQGFYILRPVGDTFDIAIRVANQDGDVYNHVYYEENESGTISINKEGQEVKTPHGEAIEFLSITGDYPWVCGYTPQLVNNKMTVIE